MKGMKKMNKQTKREKQIQISENMFVTLCKLLYALDNHQLDKYTTELKNTLKEQMDAKLEAMEKHRIYTAYKTAEPNSQIREQNRQQYLIKAGICKSWQTEKETQF